MKTEEKNAAIAHHDKMNENLKLWHAKPLLQKLYYDFYQLIASYLQNSSKGLIVELGSGIGAIKHIIPRCICTEMFDSEHIDKIENTYNLSFKDEEISNLIMFDVFHHIRYPGVALKECNRVLCKNGRLIIFEPYLSVLGWLVYGVFHDEPIAYNKTVEWDMPDGFIADADNYYAGQGNAMRVFGTNDYTHQLKQWNVVVYKRLAAISYVTSGGFTKPQLYPTKLFSFMKKVDRFCSLFPRFFATRLLVVLEKT